MRKDWETRAAADPLTAIDPSRRNWTYDDFYARGQELVATLVDPALDSLGVDPAGLRVLEIGCGVGRLLPGLTDRFGEVWGLDISPALVDLGREHCPVEATWLVGDGSSLADVERSSVDHVLSYEAFPRIPRASVIGAYLTETWRVLKPGGTFQVQLRTGSDTTGQALLRALPRFLRVGVGAGLKAVRLLRVRGDVDTWLGAIVPAREATAMLEKLGFEELTTLPDDLRPPGTCYWLTGRKPIDAVDTEPEDGTGGARALSRPGPAGRAGP